jgi:hypothetical protein
LGAAIAIGVNTLVLTPAAEAEDAMRPVVITAEPIPAFDEADTARTAFGKLSWRGGLILSANDEGFGGWSGLALSPDGGKLVAVSDRLHWLRANVKYQDGKPAALDDAMIGPLAPPDEKMKGIGHDRDAEAVALLSGTLDEGEILISFERKSRIATLDIKDATLSLPKSYLDVPPETAEIEDNGGFEAATMIRGGPDRGKIVAIAERFEDEAGNHSGWIWTNGKPERFALKKAPDFDISDVASLATGGLIVLERRASFIGGFAMRLRYLKPSEVKPGALLEGELLFESSNGHHVDNMEALAIHETADGETILSLMSDNNFSYFLQENLFLQFTLDPAIAKPASP